MESFSKLRNALSETAQKPDAFMNEGVTSMSRSFLMGVLRK
jgi:hypothetical protein